MSALTPHSTAAASTRETLLSHCLNGQAHGIAQDRAIYNPDPEINSGVEYVIAAARLLPQGPARDLLAQGLHHLRSALAHGGQERTEWRETTAVAEGIGSTGLTVKQAAARLRAPLAVLVNPILTGARRDAARSEVLQVVEEARDGLLFDSSGRIKTGLAHELHSVAKATAFETVVREAQR